MKEIPKFVYCGGALRTKTQREWKDLKRKQLKKIVEAAKLYRLDCAWCPGYKKDMGALDDILETMTDSHSVKKWGR